MRMLGWIFMKEVSKCDHACMADGLVFAIVFTAAVVAVALAVCRQKSWRIEVLWASIRVTIILKFEIWWFDAKATPLLIPNREVKLRSGDDTRKGKVASRQISNFKQYKMQHLFLTGTVHSLDFLQREYARKNSQWVLRNRSHPIPHSFRTEKLSFVVAMILVRGCEANTWSFARPERDGARQGRKIFQQENTFGSR